MSYNPSRPVSTVCNIEIYHFKEFMENNEMILTGSRGNFRKRCLEKNSGFYMVSMLCRVTKEFTRWEHDSSKLGWLYRPACIPEARVWNTAKSEFFKLFFGQFFQVQFAYVDILLSGIIYSSKDNLFHLHESDICVSSKAVNYGRLHM